MCAELKNKYSAAKEAGQDHATEEVLRHISHIY